MFKCDHKKLRLSFNEFHNFEIADRPEYGEFCLIELKDGRYTGGTWYPKDYPKKTMEGSFGRGTADSVDAAEVSKWHSLRRYDLTECLENESIEQINLGPEEEGNYTVIFKDFKSFEDQEFPMHEQYCLLILKSGELAAGRWNRWPGKDDGTFFYASALAGHGMDKVWAWTTLSPDDISAREEGREKERELEKELNKNPSADPEKFKYGTDIDVYYEKALEKLRKKYPWATLTQMKKNPAYLIVPRHGKYIFGRDDGIFMGERVVIEWRDGSTADEFIDFLCEYTEENVRNSNPEEKFKYGMDIKVYLEMAYENVKKQYRWFDKKMIGKSWNYDIKQVNGDWEFVKEYHDSSSFTVCDCGSAERFIEIVEYDYQDAALEANKVVAEYAVPFGHVDIQGWNLEKYVFYKLRTGDYKVYVQAGDRTTGGGREFFITPYCFEAKTYEEFLDRYLEIVPGESFGLLKKDLLSKKELKKFLGY
ncbi:MAG: hypothetical protein K6E85_12330 [Lachnospiraceae bacterium]|nr:hypothetical protein [Lachnospiraceae bacterium]